MRDRLREAAATLKNLYYLTQNLRSEGRSFIEEIEQLIENVDESDMPEILADLKAEIDHFKRLVGCILTNEEIDRAVDWVTSQGDAYISLPKWHIDKGFTKYNWVFPRWPHIPLHAYVQFDSNLDNPSPYGIFLLEERLFRDLKLLWKRANDLASDGCNFRTRNPDAQQDLSSYLRIMVGVIFDFLEAYLNGLAFECFRRFHDKLSLPEHDLLCERDSATKKTRFVPFERKMKKYPKLYGKYLGQIVNFDSDTDRLFLCDKGKSLRDALTHPSAFINWGSDEPPKFQLVAGLNLEQVKKVLVSAVSFVRKVEVALGHDPSLSIPWLEVEGM